MERDISWSAVLPGQGADVVLTVTSAEAWFSLAAIACAVLLTVGAFGGAVWFTAVG